MSLVPFQDFHSQCHHATHGPGCYLNHITIDSVASDGSEQGYRYEYLGTYLAYQNYLRRLGFIAFFAAAAAFLPFLVYG